MCFWSSEAECAGLGGTQCHESAALASFPDHLVPHAWLVWPVVEADVYLGILGRKGLRRVSNPNSLFLGHYQVYALHLFIALKSTNSSQLGGASHHFASVVFRSDNVV